MSSNTSSYTFGGIAIAIGIVAAGFLLSNSLKVMKISDRYVTVKGLVERIEKADSARADISFKVAGNDLIALYKELESSSARVKSFLIETGFNAGEVSEGTPNLVDTHIREYGGDKLPDQRYIITGTIYLKTKNVDAVNSLASKVGTLVSQGLNLNNYSVSYQLEKFNDLRPEMLAQAIENAKDMAKQFAEKSDSKLGGIRSANQGMMTITAAESSPGDDYSRGESSLMKKIRVVSTLDFYIKD